MDLPPHIIWHVSEVPPHTNIDVMGSFSLPCLAGSQSRSTIATPPKFYASLSQVRRGGENCKRVVVGYYSKLELPCLYRDYHSRYGQTGLLAEWQPRTLRLGNFHGGLFALQAAARCIHVKRKRKKMITLIIEQLRSTDETVNVQAILQKWVKSAQPKRSDWLDVLKDFRADKDRDLLLEIFEFALLDEKFEANVRDYTKLMCLYIKLNRCEDAERTVEIMEERGICADVALYTVLLDMYGKAGRLDKVIETFTEIKLLGLAPDVKTYCCLIDAYCRSGKPREAKVFLKEIEAANSTFRRVAYTSLMKCYGSLGQAEEAERVFQTMQLKCVYPDGRACCVLMEAYIQAGDLESAGLVLDNMLVEGFKPIDKSIACLIIAYENKNMLEMAIKTLLKLENSNALMPQSKALTSLTDWFGKLELAEV